MPRRTREALGRRQQRRGRPGRDADAAQDVGERRRSRRGSVRSSGQTPEECSRGEDFSEEGDREFGDDPDEELDAQLAEDSHKEGDQE